MIFGNIMLQNRTSSQGGLYDVPRCVTMPHYPTIVAHRIPSHALWDRGLTDRNGY